MSDSLVLRRVVEVGALLMIGEGILGFLQPRRHSLLWHCGPQILKAVTEELADHPNAARLVYLAEAVAGVALAVSQTSDEPS